MDSAVKTFDLITEEEASLYVLELLPPDEVRRFGRRLEGDASLRELVRELQGNIDSLVLAQPFRPAPLHVWGRIATEVKEAETRTIPFPVRFGTWGLRLLAAAACLALGAFLQSRRGPLVYLERALPEAPRAAGPLVEVARQGPIALPEPASPTPHEAPANSLAPVTEPGVVLEAIRLQEQVRVLASQVAALNQVLTRQVQPVSLPAGVTRLQVFRLANTNTPATSRAEAETRSWPDTLAALATGQSASTRHPSDSVALESGAEPRELEREKVAGNEVAANGADPATPSNGRLLNEAQPIGFYDEETGRGAIALLNATPSAQQNFVVWSQTAGADGSAVLQNVGATSADASSTVISFNAPTTSAGTPNFFVTLEPADGTAGSAVPTGPVVALPPQP